MFPQPRKVWPTIPGLTLVIYGSARSGGAR
jgi:hypothetical protein